jgi:hypothetical protein
MERPKCVVCGKRVMDYKKLRHSVTWDSGEMQGKYMHSRCFIDSGEAEKEMERALLPMKIALRNLVKK